MRVLSFDNPAAFAERVTPLLVRREAENCFLLGRISEFLGGHPPPPGTLMLSVEDNSLGGPVAAGLLAPSQPLVVTRADAGAIDAIVRHLVEAGARPGAVSSVDATSAALAAAWSAATGAVAQSEFGAGLFQLTRLIPPAHPGPGHFRAAGEGEVDALVAWAGAFFTEIRHFSPPHLPRVVTDRIREDRLFLWCDPAGQPVSMAGWAGQTPNGVRVNFVYTPPEHRGCGYATSCVAALTRRLLDSGRTFCFLFTDLANLTSNRIYRSIGYEHVCDFRDVRFEPGP